VDAGPHDVRVWVPYVLPRRAGKARTKVSVPPGETMRLEYLAPTLAFRGGSKITDCRKTMIIRFRACSLLRHDPHAPFARRP